MHYQDVMANMLTEIKERKIVMSSTLDKYLFVQVKCSSLPNSIDLLQFD